MWAAVFITLSIGSKQTQIPLLVLLPLYVLRVDGWRAAMTLAGATAGLLGGMTLLCIGIWGWDAIHLAWFGIAAGQPWHYAAHGKLASFLIWSGTLVAEALMPALVMMVLYLFMNPHGRTKRARSPSLDALLRQPWILPLAVAVVMAPLGVMGIAKRGGWGNSLSITTYYLAAASAALVASYRWGRALRQIDRAYVRAVMSTAALLVIALGIWSVTPFSNVRTILIGVADMQHNPEQAAYEFARSHPGRAYFPRNPLAALLAEGRYYIFEFAMQDELMAGYTFAPQRVWRNLPPGMQIIAFPPERTAGIARMELPGFTERVEVPELTDWTVFRRPTAPQSP
jgi:hypothetical protein